MPQADLDDLLFITYTKAPHPRWHDSKTRRAVRQKVWNAWRNEEPKRRLESSATKSLAQSQSRFRLPVPPRPGAGQKSQILKSPSPWQNVIESSGDHAWSLLDYYFHRFRQNSTAINVEGDWISFTFSDDPIRHAQLALIALNAKYDYSTTVGHELALSHIDQATKIIRERLHYATEKPTCTLIGAVALLLIIDSMQDDHQRAIVHFRGLNCMLALHGGLSAFSSMKTLHRVISWAQRCYWLSWPSERPVQAISPLYTTVNSSLAKGNEHRLYSTPTSHKLHRLRDILCEALVSILHKLQYIATFPPSHTRSQLDRLHISGAIYNVEEECIRFYNEKFFPNNGNAGDGPSTLTVLVAAGVRIYIFVILRQISTKSSVVQRYAKSLTADLKSAQVIWGNLNHLPNSVLELLIWVTTLLLLTKSDNDNYSIPVTFFTNLLRMMNISSLDELEHALRQIAWMDDVVHFAELWKEIEMPLNQ